MPPLNHRAWTKADGAPSGIRNIAQSADGTLWLASSHGLFRFDGLRFIRYDGPANQRFASNNVAALTALPEGGLWIGFTFGGVSLLQDGHLTQYAEPQGIPRGTVKNIVRDQSGVMYVASTGGLARLEGDHWVRVNLDTVDANTALLQLLSDRAGTFWLLTDKAILTRAPGATQFVPVRKADQPQPQMSLAPDDSVWVAALGVGAAPRYGIDRLTAHAGSQINIQRLLSAVDTRGNIPVFDHEGNLWLFANTISLISASALAAHLSDAQLAQHLQTFDGSNGLSGLVNEASLVDREGNVWVATSAGLDRFSRSNFARLLNEPKGNGAIVPGENGAVWASMSGTAVTGDHPVLLEIRNGSITRRQSSPSYTAAFQANDRSVWLGGPMGLAHIVNGHLVAQPLPPEAADSEVQSIVEDRDGALWVSIVRRGVFRVANGEWSAYGGLESLPRMPAIIETVDADGHLWFGYTNNQIARVNNTVVSLFDTRTNLKVGNVTAFEARRGRLWVGGELGLERFEGERFVEIHAQADDPLVGISGIVETVAGDLWINGSRGVVRVTRDELARAEKDAAYRVRFDLFNHLDGIPGDAMELRPIPSAVEASDGRLWFSTNAGLVSLDPTHIQRNPLPPPVTIWSITSGGVKYPTEFGGRIHLPIHTTNLRIEFSAGSLTVPERVRFRYQLEGLDSDWQGPDGRHEAGYTNLGPGHYTFRVIASNNDGVWNNTGSSLDFTIAPAFYQTMWFDALCTLAGLGLLLAVYRVRLAQVRAQVRGRLEERLAERERIARELHDTLLQGIQGLVLRFQAAANRIPQQEPARALMERALERADDVLREGRDRVKDLRSSPGEDQDLPAALAAAGKHLALGHTAVFRAKMMGTQRELHPIVRDEALLITREALTNAFLHADAQVIDVEIVYSHAELRVIIRDDGRGIDSEILQAGGRPGHWGLLGMRERAQKIRATLRISSSPQGGTEIDLRIPAQVAYLGTSSKTRPRE